MYNEIGRGSEHIVFKKQYSDKLCKTRLNYLISLSLSKNKVDIININNLEKELVLQYISKETKFEQYLTKNLFFLKSKLKILEKKEIDFTDINTINNIEIIGREQTYINLKKHNNGHLNNIESFDFTTIKKELTNIAKRKNIVENNYWLTDIFFNNFNKDVIHNIENKINRIGEEKISNLITTMFEFSKNENEIIDCIGQNNIIFNNHNKTFTLLDLFIGDTTYSKKDKLFISMTYTIGINLYLNILNKTERINWDIFKKIT